MRATSDYEAIKTYRQTQPAEGAYCNVVLIAGHETRDNARVVITGSLDFSSSTARKVNGSQKYYASGNKDLTISLTIWCSRQSDVLYVKSVDHDQADETKSAKSAYTSMDDFCTMETEEYKKWRPCLASHEQLDLRHIDPFSTNPTCFSNDKFQPQYKILDGNGIYFEKSLNDLKNVDHDQADDHKDIHKSPSDNSPA